jgi:hypothetical protein
MALAKDLRTPGKHTNYYTTDVVSMIWDER